MNGDGLMQSIDSSERSLRLIRQSSLQFVSTIAKVVTGSQMPLSWSQKSAK